ESLLCLPEVKCEKKSEREVSLCKLSDLMRKLSRTSDYSITVYRLPFRQRTLRSFPLPPESLQQTKIFFKAGILFFKDRKFRELAFAQVIGGKTTSPFKMSGIIRITPASSPTETELFTDGTYLSPQRGIIPNGC